MTDETVGETNGRVRRAISGQLAPGARRRWRLVGGAASALLFAVSIWILAHILTASKLAELRGDIAATSADQLALACAATIFSYIALTGYDVLALRQLRIRVPYYIAAFASFTSYAISFMLGFQVVTGGTVRYWIYSREGVSAAKVASLTVIAGVTFWLGLGLAIGCGLVFRAQALSEINDLKVFINAAIGLAIVAFIVGYLVWVSLGRRRIRVQGFSLELPGPGVTLAQMALGVVDICASASVLYVLLPQGHGLDFLTFVAIYAFACLLGIASHAPGGIGVFEATMLQAVPNVGNERLLASLILFRMFYFVAPFILALALLGANEIGRRWRSLREAILRSKEED
ncbi:lysylphosphatidylglycerol synthase domain-containing protein [Methylovirgula sp. 4M-Z18]|uniref:lysylphosphatidylglycerol synthase domain-containing protein n=1 Tax=Methylovirgula sp. 4M-Z18 TaxID=2293567 RepID=UPI000E2FA446|nr:lysylphosphatidylglycerol synthase domain-containing protein [Methylovirgula sp. 4M-Z18]RFB79328.1 UPF0104 family protein [Methylovirgula sp. 4M-Z18]